MKVAVVGGSGFIGSAVSRALEARGETVVEVSAPRLRLEPTDDPAAVKAAAESVDVDGLADAFAGCDAVVNAAGLSNAAGTDEGAMFGANALLPEVIARAVDRAGVGRYVHVSSAGVLGSERLSETSQVFPFSTYTRSKALGEKALLGRSGGARVVVYRPTSVQGEGRQVTARLVSMAGSRLASVADPQAETPQCLVDNVGDAAAFLATTPRTPQMIVLHPWEGMTTGELLTVLGGRKPRRVPKVLARVAIAAAYVLERAAGRQPANARRLEMMWFGQPSMGSWLTSAGWTPPVGREGWTYLATQPVLPEPDSLT